MFDSELTILDVIWDQNGITAKEIAKILKEKKAWSRTTTYTVISRCIQKGYISRGENYACFHLITKEKVQQKKFTDTITQLFDGSISHFFSAFAESNSISDAEKEKLKKLINELD